MNSKILHSVVYVLIVLHSAIAQTNFTILKSCSLMNGIIPQCGLVMDTNGLFYGSTGAGGISNMGTVFVIKPDGTGHKVLQHFTGTNGSGPLGSLVLSTNGNLYGVTYGGGISNFGTV